MTWIEELIAEVERLRAQRVLSNEDFARSFDLGLAAGERRERAAVVTYLRYEAERLTGTNTTDAFRASEYLGASADEIARGEHLRAEGESE